VSELFEDQGMINAFWKLTVVTEHSNFSALGTEEVMRQAISEWREYLTNGLDDHKAVLRVEGLYDSADRAECVLVTVMSKIDSMSLVKM